jgi:hypothetical protein
MQVAFGLFQILLGSAHVTEYHATDGIIKLSCKRKPYKATKNE